MAVEDAKAAWLQRVLGIGGAAPAASLESGLQAWAQARSAVVASLKSLERAIRAMKDPMGDKAVILVRSIAANLTQEPRSRQSVAELRRYLASDSVIDDAELPNGFGISVRIRAPLTAALDALEPALSA